MQSGGEGRHGPRPGVHWAPSSLRACHAAPQTLNNRMPCEETITPGGAPHLGTTRMLPYAPGCYAGPTRMPRAGFGLPPGCRPGPAWKLYISQVQQERWLCIT